MMKAPWFKNCRLRSDIGLSVVIFHLVVVICRHTGCLADISNQTQAVSDVLDHLLDGYNKELRPGIGGSRIVVETGILIKSMGPISENDMSYSMQIYFRQKWKDERLSFYLPNVTEFTLSNRFMQHIWKPNSYFLNGRDSKQHNLTVPNAFVRLSYDGSLYVSMRLTVNARCPMMLSRYPMDQAVCPLFIASFGYTTEEVLYEWMKEVEIDPGVTLSSFELGQIRHRNSSKVSRFGEFSILEVYIHLTRAVGFYILQTYVPCYLIVSISWVSFWINRDAAPARVLLGVTTILSTSTISLTVREGLPRVPYATALDVFINVCIVYEMAALMEYAAVNYYTKMVPKEVSSDEEEDDIVLSVRYTPSSHSLSSNQGKSSQGPSNHGVFVQGPSNHSPSNHGPSGSSTASGGTVREDAETNSEQKTPEKTTLLLHNNHPDPERNGYQGNKGSKAKKSCFNSMWSCIVGNSREGQSSEPWTVNSVSNIDILARLWFPLTFAIFNLCYWVIYIHLEIS